MRAAPADPARAACGRIAADLLPAAVVPEAVARIEEPEVEDVAAGVVLMPGTAALLASLPAERWAVVTSATRRPAEARLAEVGVRPRPLTAADDITRGQPDPEPFRRPPARPASTRPAAWSSRTCPRL